MLAYVKMPNQISAKDLSLCQVVLLSILPEMLRRSIVTVHLVKERVRDRRCLVSRRGIRGQAFVLCAVVCAAEPYES